MKCFLLACVAGLLLSTSTTAVFAAAPRKATGAFEVVGTRIYDPQGREFVAKGANVNGVNWVWPRSTVADEKWIVDQWKFNFLRVNCRLEKGPWPDNDDLDKIVETFTRRKIVVMPEMHDYSGSAYPEVAQPNKPTLADLVAWWKATAAKYKNNPYVWFNVMNEPGYLEDVDKTPWYSLHKTVVDAIRSTGAKNIIVCDGHGFANEADETGTGKVRTNKSAILTYGPRLLADDPVHRIVYAFHVYGGWNFGDEKMADYVDRVQAKNLALIAGEYAQQPQYDFTAGAQTMFNVCVPRGVGRVVWHWFPGDGNSLTAAEKRNGNESGWAIDRTDGTRPTNLSWLGERIWNDNHDLPPPGADLGFPLSKARWTVTASHWDEKNKENKPAGRFVPALAADNDPASYWDSGAGDAPDRYLQIDLGEKQTFHQIVLDPRKDFLNFAPAYKIYTTNDPAVAAGPTSGWGAPVAQGTNRQTVLRVTFPVQNARYVRAVLPGAPGGKSLFIHEVDLYAPGTGRLTRAATTGEPNRDLLWVGQVKAPATGLFRFAAPRDPLAQIRVNGYAVSGNRPVTLVAGQNYDVAVAPMTSRVNGPASPPPLTWTYAGQPKFVPVSSHLLHGRLGGRHEGGTLLPRQRWTATASNTGGGDKPASALDGDPFTRWSSGAEQAPGQFLQLDLGRAQVIEKVVLEVGKFGGDFPRGYELYLSGDGENWGTSPVASGAGGVVTTIAFSPRVARFVKVVTTKSAPGAWFSVAEINVFGPDDTKVPVLSFAPAR